MANEELLEMRGRVTEPLSDAMFRVELENGHEARGRSASEIGDSRIPLLTGDVERAEFTNGDLIKGRSAYRFK